LRTRILAYLRTLTPVVSTRYAGASVASPARIFGHGARPPRGRNPGPRTGCYTCDGGIRIAAYWNRRTTRCTGRMSAGTPAAGASSYANQHCIAPSHSLPAYLFFCRFSRRMNGTLPRLQAYMLKGVAAHPPMPLGLLGYRHPRAAAGLSAYATGRMLSREPVPAARGLHQAGRWAPVRRDQSQASLRLYPRKRCRRSLVARGCVSWGTAVHDASRHPLRMKRTLRPSVAMQPKHSRDGCATFFIRATTYLHENRERNVAQASRLCIFGAGTRELTAS